MPDRIRKPYSRPEPRSKPTNGMWVHDRAPTAPKAELQATTSNTKLVVSNLHYDITPKDLIAIFGQIGTLIREPMIRYDRSGRSSGVAIISFETAPEASRAKKQFDGILAKGQPMSIAFDTMLPLGVRNARRSVNTPASSLLNRIQKPPLLERLSRGDSKIKTPSGPRGGAGPIRTKAQVATGRSGPKKPKTAEELDKELDAFMGDSEVATPSAPAPVAAADVDMA